MALRLRTTLGVPLAAERGRWIPTVAVDVEKRPKMKLLGYVVVRWPRLYLCNFRYWISPMEGTYFGVEEEAASQAGDLNATLERIPQE
ncbi:MAG: hypothetical protein WAS49_00935 [Candidatus Dechloromonas phosphoritropha]